MTAPGSSLGSCRVWVISSFLGLGFFCADTPGTRTRQQAHANSGNLFMVLLPFRVAVNGAWAWAGIMGLIPGRRRSGRCVGARIRIVANDDLTSAVAASLLVRQSADGDGIDRHRQPVGDVDSGIEHVLSGYVWGRADPVRMCQPRDGT